jgi:hypothetical protein
MFSSEGFAARRLCEAILPAPDCLVALSLAMISRHASAPPATRHCVRALHKTSSESRGRRECRMPNAPAASRASEKSTRARHHRYAEPFRHSLHDGFNGFLRVLPGDRAFLSPSSLRSVSSQKLDTSVGVPGRHDFAVRLQVRSSSALEASIASRTNVRDDAYAPLVGRDGRIDRTASSKRPREKFCEKTLDTNLRGVPVGQITSLEDRDRA